jgi:hypothetical protein
MVDHTGSGFVGKTAETHFRIAREVRLIIKQSLELQGGNEHLTRLAPGETSHSVAPPNRFFIISIRLKSGRELANYRISAIDASGARDTGWRLFFLSRDGYLLDKKRGLTMSVRAVSI